MGDDFSALELDTELDNDMRALFGDSQDSVGPSMQSCSTMPVIQQPQFPPPSSSNSLIPLSRASQPRPETSLLCITNKRPATELNQSWPYKCRQSVQAIGSNNNDSAYDDLELDLSPTAHSTVSGRAHSSSSRPTSKQTSTFAAQPDCFTAPVPAASVLNPSINPASQATEQWHSAYSQKSLQASQVSATLQNASARHQLPHAHAFTSARQCAPSARPLLPGCLSTNIASAMVSKLVAAVHE